MSQDNVFRPWGFMSAGYGKQDDLRLSEAQERLEEIRTQYEADPTGRSAHEKGAKLDAGKNRLGLVLLDFAPALVEVGKVGTFGANKYTDHGWLTGPNGEQRYTDALFRHLMAEGVGEELDRDSELLHASHLAWNALARLTFILKRRQLESQAVVPNVEESCPK